MSAAVEALTLTWGDRTMTLREWSRVRSVFLLGITMRVMRDRLALGWDVERVLTTPEAPRATRGKCATCGDDVERPGSITIARLRCESCHGLHMVADAPVDSTTRFERDPVAQAFVRVNPDGASTEDIGAALGISRQRVDQLLDKVMPRFIRRCLEEGIDEEDLLEMLSARLSGLRSPMEATGFDQETCSAVNGYVTAQRAIEEESTPRPSALAERVEALLADVEARSGFVGAITKRAAEIEP